MAEKREALRLQAEAERAAAGPKPQVVGGTKWTAEGARVDRTGDRVNVHYKVLKLGKRSYDGLSGEGTVVFSRGYALEDDEKAPGDKSFKFTLGDDRVIRALSDAVPGMAVGGTRHISVTPQNGWEKGTAACDGGPGGGRDRGEI
jgi:FKBP-type peptidyl-prolyl cis-trans isomerase